MTVLSLSDVREYFRFDVVADGAFETLGFLTDPLPRMLTFLEDRRYLPALRAAGSLAAVITTPALQGEVPAGLGIATTPRPRRAFVTLHNALARTAFYTPTVPSIIDPKARVHPRAIVAERNVQIGADTVIEANAVVQAGTFLGCGVVVRAGAVLGGEGFQTCRDAEGYLEMAHAGSLWVEDGVHVFSNATIARGLFRQATRIGANTRVGNNAFVSHNAVIGARCFIGHGAVVNGNTTIGTEAWIGPGAVLANNLQIGERARISLGAVVIGDVAAREHVSGNFAIPHRKLLRHVSEIS